MQKAFRCISIFYNKKMQIDGITISKSVVKTLSFAFDKSDEKACDAKEANFKFQLQVERNLSDRE
jgi:hypothetical protein